MSYNELNNLFQEIDEEDVSDDTLVDDIPEEKTTRRRRKPAPEPELEPQLPILEDGEEYCKACEGTGNNSKGRECSICEGTGVVKIKEEPEPKQETRRRRRAPEVEAENDGEKCPSGHKFGKECDDHADCAKCKSWNDCADEQDKK